MFNHMASSIERFAVQLVVLIVFACSLLDGRTSVHAETVKNGFPLTQSGTKKVIIYINSAQGRISQTHWYLSDPLILAECELQVTKVVWMLTEIRRFSATDASPLRLYRDMTWLLYHSRIAISSNMSTI